jgi:outer membrane protein assembly factor BamB
VIYAGAQGAALYALDATNKGKQLWNFTVATKGDIYAAPVVSGGLVYTHGHVTNEFTHPLYALRAADGTKVWETNPDQYLLGFATPLVDKGTLYLPSYGVLPPVLVIPFDATTGEEQPSAGPEGVTASSPAIAGTTLYIGGGDGFLYALDAANGLRLVWRQNILNDQATSATPGTATSQSDTAISSTPAVANGVVYIGSLDHNLYALDATTGKVLWTYATGDVISFSSPAVAGGIVYVGSVDQALHAVDAATGKVRWKYPTGAKVMCSPTVANGVVYFGSYDHNVYALDAQGGKLLRTYQANDAVFGTPRVVNGVLYFGSYDNYVYAFPV